MLSTGTESLFRDMQKIANKIKSDVERQLSRDFKTFDVIEDLTPSIRPDERSYYRMKIRTDDNGHVRVKTMQKDPGSDWKVEVEEYDRGDKKSLEQSKEKGQKQLDYYKDTQSVANRIRSDIEKQLNEAFKTFEVFENRFAIKTDNNGQLKVRTSQKDAESNLNVEVEKFEKGGKELEEPKKKSFMQPDFFRDMQDMANRIKSDVENQLNQAFKTFEVFENRLRIKTDNNGELKVKASQSESGSGVKVDVEEYNKGSRIPGEAGFEKGGKMTVEH
jgi:frataxin-like iron-binding protein CyaY